MQHAASGTCWRLQALLAIKVYSFKDAVVAVSTEATQELALEELLAKVQTKWSAVELSVLPYKDLKDVFILGGIEDVQVAHTPPHWSLIAACLSPSGRCRQPCMRPHKRTCACVECHLAPPVALAGSAGCASRLWSLTCMVCPCCPCDGPLHQLDLTSYRCTPSVNHVDQCPERSVQHLSQPGVAAPALVV
jgi:hypothetical protein